MKPVTFKKTYVASADFSPQELTWFVNAALENVYASFKDKSQFDNIMNDVKNNLADTFEKGNYTLQYKGPDYNTHLFSITNGINTIDILMSENLFKTHFQTA